MENLKYALEKKGVTIKALAALLGISEKSAWNKVNGASEFTYKEAMLVKDNLLPEYDCEWLFRKTA